MKHKKVLTDYQENFIKENYLTMLDKDMGEHLGLTVNFLIAYRATKGLYKNVKPKVVKMDDGLFHHCSNKKTWAI